MTLPVPHRGRTPLIIATAALSALVAGFTSAQAQNAPAAGASAPAAAAAVKKPAAKPAAAKSESASYSVGVSFKRKAPT